MSSVSVLLPLRRTRWFRDCDDVLATSKRSADVVELVIDWTDQLKTGETVSAVAYVDSGVKRATTTNTTTTSSTNVTGIGETEVTASIVTAPPVITRKLTQLVRFYDVEGAHASDYD